MNYTWIAGHLGSEPETRFTPSGKKVVSLRVACKSRKGGKDETMWWKVTIWGDTFDKILPYFKKGSPIVVCGEMTPPEIYQNREGGTQVSLGITANHISFSPFGKGKSNEEGGGGAQGFTSSNSSEMPAFQGANGLDFISDEEIPF
jgi:single-strand DNA-binding protein